MTKRIIAFDCETYPILDSLKAPPLVCLTHAERGKEPDILDARAAVDWWIAALRDPSIYLVGHNTAYDVGVMLAACPESVPLVFEAYDAGRFFDTQNRQMLIDNARGRFGDGAAYNLAELAARYLKRDRSAAKKGADVWRLRYNELADVPVVDWPEDARRYALDDAVDTLDVVYAQGRPLTVWAGGRQAVVVRRDGTVVNESDQVRAALALQLMSIWGLRTDARAVVDLTDRLRAQSDALAVQLKAIGFLRPDGTEDKATVQRAVINALTIDATPEQRQLVADKVAAARAHFEAYQAELVVSGERKKPLEWSSTRNTAAEVSAWVRDAKIDLPLTDKGNIPTGVEILEEITSREIELLVEFKGVNKRLSTYCETMLRAGSNPVCPGYNPFVRSGRCSSSKPNVQNFPRGGGERECFVPRAGKLFISSDYSTLELRSWAQACIDLGINSQMAVALRQGRDLHSALASTMLGWSYDDMIAALAGDLGSEKKSTAKTYRSVAKPANFGLPVGMGKAKFMQSARKSYGVHLKDDQATKAIDAFKSLWSEAPQYFNWVSGLLEPVRDEIVKLPDGTETIKTIRLCNIIHPRSGRVRGGCYFTDAANSYFQGLAADGAKAALWAVCRACYADPSSTLFGARPVAFIHDEIIVEADAARASEVADALCALMIDEMSVWLPDVPVVCEPALMNRWTKAAESTRRSDGRWSVWFYEVGELRRAGRDSEADALEREMYASIGW